MSYITVDELRVANPCQSAEWSDEKGENFSRLCKTCDKNVYNLSLMTLDEANDLIRQKEGKLCISLYHGLNGKVLTADAPKSLRGLRRKYLKARAKTIALALAIWGFITGTTTSCHSPVNGFYGSYTVPNVTADINGKPFESRYGEGVNDTTVNEIWINATNYDSSSMWIFIDSAERTPDTYENHRGVLVAGGYNDHINSNSYYWYNGELKITSINSTHASGTFWFDAARISPTDTVHVRNGRFDVPIVFGKIPH